MNNNNTQQDGMGEQAEKRACGMQMTLGADVKLRVRLKCEFEKDATQPVVRDCSLGVLYALALRGSIQDEAVIDADTGEAIELENYFPLACENEDEVSKVKIYTPHWAQDLPEDAAYRLGLGADVQVQPPDDNSFTPVPQVPLVVTDNHPLRLVECEVIPYDPTCLKTDFPTDEPLQHPLAFLLNITLERPCSLTAIMESPDRQLRSELKIRGDLF